MLGSPLHVRGKAPYKPLIHRVIGITPAYAGKSITSCPVRTAGKDHPRVCGEKSTSFACNAAMSGSPPRVRGKGCSGSCPCESAGITPAYAGKRPITADRYALAGDHPRVCGEKWINARCGIRTRGSPPRMRGKAGHGVEGGQHLGITPAYAGKRVSSIKWQWKTRDHPRVCGEKVVAGRVQTAAKGSPPRMRGKAGQRRRHFRNTGITPAYAGKR